jgi:glutamate-1-semialdehyde 2,1-aminomutase
MSRYQTSQALWERAKLSLAGGVSSNVRAAGQPPLYFEHAQGARLVDVDGNSYLDYVLGQGPMLLGHSPAFMLEFVSKAIQHGQLYAGQHRLEVELAEKLQQLIPCAELVRLGNSGSEVVHAALRLARGHTGRDKVLKFEGHYHGWYDDQLISVMPPLAQAGNRDNPHTVPGSAGQSKRVLGDIIVSTWNDIDLLRTVVRQHGSELAAILMEPVMCNVGCIPPQPGFLEAVRELCTEQGIVLVFDEVITGFRLGLGGAQGYYDVTPDLATFAKAMANGFPISCLAGKREIMQHIADLRVNHSGTYNSNVAATAAALACVAELERTAGEIYPRLFELGQALREGLQQRAAKLGLNVVVQGIGPIAHVAFTSRDAIVDYRTWLESNNERYLRFTSKMLDRGIRILARGLWYISTAHTAEDIAFTLDTAEQVWGELLERDPLFG